MGMPVPKIGDKGIFFARLQEVLFMHLVASVKVGSGLAVLPTWFGGSKDVKMRASDMAKKHASSLTCSLGKLSMPRDKGKNRGLYQDYRAPVFCSKR